MPRYARTLSALTGASLASQSTGSAYLLLVTLDGEGFASPYHFVQNSENVVSRGETYLYCPFDLSLPEETDNNSPSVTLQVYADPAIIAEVRRMTSRPELTLEVVASHELDVVVAGPFNFVVNDITYDSTAITGELSFEDILNEPLSSKRITPGRFPTLF